jgi:hypothetical protein
LHVQFVISPLPGGEVEKSGHGLHSTEPGDENLPFGHKSHWVAPIPVKYVPEGQSWQSALPIVDLYRPALHAAHSLLEFAVTPIVIFPEYPAVHLQFGLPAAEVENCGHAKQVELLVAE